ncbi:hypothetical protein F5880DRAFT_1512303 [Lentinula raphanica]|nr:hypothetical protein F5880DRAFT_1512303 [Lentinula raphanica]
MDYSQIFQQSLQAMLANNPQLILQLMQQTSPSASASASGSNGPPLSISPQPPNSSHLTPPPSSSEASLVSSLASGPAMQSVPTTSQPISASTPTPTPAPLPSTSSLTTSLHSQPAPPVTTYISPLNMLSSLRASGSSGHPLPSLMPPASPFHSLTTIERANRDRNEHAAMVSTSADSGRRRQRRGQARRLPRLNGLADPLKVDDTIATASDGSAVVSLVVLVYPPKLTPQECHIHNLPPELHHYVQNRDAFETVLSSVNLVRRYDNLPLSTKVVDLLEAVQESLSQSGWVFPPNPSIDNEPFSIFRRHERLPIQLLRFVGRGNINNTAKTPRLISGNVESEDMTLAQIVLNPDYGVAKYAVTPEKKFLLHTIIRSPNVSFNVNLFEKGLGSDDTVCTHYCLSKRIYGIFRCDADALVYEGYRALHEPEIEFGCNRDVDEDAELRVVAQMLNVGPSSSSSTNQGVPNLQPPPPFPSTIQLHGSPESAPMKILWDDNWVPPVTESNGRFSAFDRSPLFKFMSERHRRLFDIEEPGFVIKGQNTEEMVQAFTTLVRKANMDRDFTALLSEHRHFQLVNIDQDGVETFVSSGPGIEKEVLNLFFSSNLKAASTLVTNVIEDYTTLATVPMSLASDISLVKKDSLIQLGSVVGLSLVHGIYPANINPLLLVYLLNDCNLSSITKSLVLEYFPTLHQTLIRWLALDYDDNSTLSLFEPHFATYHNLQVSALRDRSARQHQSLAWTMLHNAIIGPESVNHPYFVAFMQGFLLPCGRLGVNLSEIARRFEGGMSEFVTTLLETRIDGDYKLLRIDYTKQLSDPVHRAVEDAVSLVFPALSATGFSGLFQQFLEGSGLPPPLTVHKLQGRFAEVVSLANVSKKSYRMKMFCWACTGVPCVLLDGPYTEVILVHDDSPQYLSKHIQGHL